MPLRYDHVVFDLDGTVYDSTPCNVGSLCEALKTVRPDTGETYESLTRFSGVSAEDTLRRLGFSGDEIPRVLGIWYAAVPRYLESVRMFDELMPLFAFLVKNRVKLGIATSRDRDGERLLGQVAAVFPQELKPYFDIAVCASDCERGKPWPDMLKLYLEKSGADPKRTLFVGDTRSDLECARAAGVDFALCMWGYCGRESLRPQHFLTTPWDLCAVIFGRRDETSRWLKWASEIQAIGQIGLAYSKDQFDIERFTRLREIACEIMSFKTGAPEDEVRESIAFESGYACPKVDTRAAIFDDLGRILMVRESRSGKWNLPGGWCDDGETAVSNTLKEVREEACMLASPLKLVAVLDRNRHNRPRLPFNVVKIFIECRGGEQNFKPTDETVDCRYFTFGELETLDLRLDTNTPDQLALCFAAHAAERWTPVLE